MDPQRFDRLARAIGAGTSRRDVLKALTGGALGAIFNSVGDASAATRKRSAGNSCVANSDCASGVCVKQSRTRSLCGCGSAAECPATTAPCRNASCVAGVCGSTVATGASCDDGNRCTVNDVCQSDGTCAGTPVGCPPPDQCHLAGTCDSQTGACNYPTAPEGTLCGSGGVCQSGICSCAGTLCNNVCLSAGQCCAESDCAGTTTDPCNEAYCDQTSHACATRVNTNDTRCTDQANSCQTAYCSNQGQCIVSVLCVTQPCKTTVGCSPQGECLYEDVPCLPIDNCHTASCEGFGGCTQTPKCGECQVCDPSTGACSAGPDFDPGTGANTCGGGLNQCCQGSCVSECCNGEFCTNGEVCSRDELTDVSGCCPLGQVLCTIPHATSEQCVSALNCCGGVYGQARCGDGDTCCPIGSACCNDGTCCAAGCCGDLCCADGYQCCPQSGGSSFCIPNADFCSPACGGQPCPDSKPFCCGSVCCSTECIVNRLGIFCFT